VIPVRRLFLAVSSLLLAVALVLIALGIASCGMEDSSRFNDAFCVAAARDPESFDAFDWLKDPYGGPKRLGKLGTDEGLGLATEIQARGAKTVLAAKVHTLKGPEPYQYAEGLVVELPDDLVKRRRVFELYARILRGEGFEPQADTGQKYLYFVWRQ
jgi:hypothetical protein